MAGLQRVGEVHRQGEGLSPPNNQTLPINLLSSVFPVVFLASQINTSN
jgi:hypothetical protein